MKKYQNKFKIFFNHGTILAVYYKWKKESKMKQ